MFASHSFTFLVDFLYRTLASDLEAGPERCVAHHFRYTLVCWTCKLTSIKVGP